MRKVDRVEQVKAEFMRLAEEAFDRMLREDQEGLVTFTQLEDRALEVGGKLQAWLLKQSVAQKAQASAGQAAPRCPKCNAVLAETDGEREERAVQTRAGPVVWQRPRYTCPSCRKVFSPAGLSVGAERRGI